jgi:hypothetical protein
MPINGMNVGVDYTLAYFSPTTGALVNLGDVQNVTITYMKHDIASRPYNAPPKFGFVPDGYRLTFTITRAISTLEDLMVTFEQNFNTGQLISAGFINETIKNADGTVSTYQYTSVVIFVTDLGDISREKTITLKVEAMASTKVDLTPSASGF